MPDLDPGLLPGEDALPGPLTLERNTVRLVGQARERRATRIMVTMPTDAARDPALVRRMVAAGMDVARINCAHDGPREWAAMLEHLRAAAAELGTDLRVAMDLAGPKVRTGPVAPDPRVEKIKPERDATGHVRRPARLRLGTQRSEDVPAVPVEPQGWLAARTVGERLRLRDARDSGRTLRVVEVHEDAVLVEFSKTVYFATGIVLRAPDGAEAVLGELPETEQSLRVAVGETLRLLNHTDPVPAEGTAPLVIGCTLPEAFRDAAAGHRVWLDDGRIGGVIRSVHPQHMDVEITHAGPTGSRLRAEKGINFPDTDLHLPALTEKDREDLAFVARHADIVNMSFVRSAQDVADLLARLEALDARSVDVTLKIETVGGFEHLSMILLEVMRWQDSGVMIARGDLAVETGFERMAEVQQEILWLRTSRWSGPPRCWRPSPRGACPPAPRSRTPPRASRPSA
ncbi:pyruvate kinase [Kocuria rhizophila]